VELVALIGNGCSIAYNPELAMGPLTKSILTELAETDSNIPAVEEALTDLAEAANRETGDRIQFFEDLFGPLERIGRSLAAMDRLGDILGGAAEISDALRKAGEFGEELHRRALGSALHVVAEKAKGNQNGLASENVRVPVDWLNKTRAGGQVRVFTLNYDALLDGAIFQLASEVSGLTVSDMADGRYATSFRVEGFRPVKAYPLRDDEEYPRDFVIYHLHGSLQWFEVDGRIWKAADLDDLRDLDFWRRYAQDTISSAPAVILSDQKTRAIERDPFRWAYDRFGDALQSAHGLLVVGYGFGDIPVNRTILRGVIDTSFPIRVVDRTDDAEGRKEAIINSLVDLDDGPAWRKERTRTLLTDRLTVVGEGVPDAFETLDWE